MKLDVQVEALSFAFRALNVLLMFTGVSAVGFAVFILFGESLLTVLQSEEFAAVGGVMGLTGMLMFVASWALGSGSFEERRVLLLYVGFYIFTILGQLFVILLMFMSKDKTERRLHHTVDQIIQQYTGNSSEDALMDRIQRHEACCGRAGPADWQKNSYVQSLNLSDRDVLPCSCFNSSRPVTDSLWCVGTGNSYDQGCQQKLTDWLRENALTVVGLQLAVLILEVLLLTAAVALHRALRRRAALQKTHSAAEGGEQNFGFGYPDDSYADHAHPAHHHDNLKPDPAYLSYHHDDQHS